MVKRLFLLKARVSNQSLSVMAGQDPESTTPDLFFANVILEHLCQPLSQPLGGADIRFISNRPTISGLVNEDLIH